MVTYPPFLYFHRKPKLVGYSLPLHVAWIRQDGCNFGQAMILRRSHLVLRYPHLDFNPGRAFPRDGFTNPWEIIADIFLPSG